MLKRPDLNIDSSFISVIPDDYVKYITNIPPAYLEKTEAELAVIVRPTVIDRRIKVSFWIEYENAIASNRRIRMVYVSNPVTNISAFVRSYLMQPAKLAWILKRPVSYAVAMEEALIYGVDRLREILEMPIINAKGEYDVRRAAVILNAINMVDQRVRGGITQKIQSMNLNVEAKARDSIEFKTIDEIDKRIAQLEGRASELRPQISSGKPDGLDDSDNYSEDIEVGGKDA